MAEQPILEQYSIVSNNMCVTRKITDPQSYAKPYDQVILCTRLSTIPEELSNCTRNLTIPRNVIASPTTTVSFHGCVIAFVRSTITECLRAECNVPRASTRMLSVRHHATGRLPCVRASSRADNEANRTTSVSTTLDVTDAPKKQWA